MRYIGICKRTKQGNTNYGQVWEKGEDGKYRSMEYEYVHRESKSLEEFHIKNDAANGYLAELTQETIQKLQTELKRNPTTIELADYLSKERRGKLLSEMVRNDEELGLYDTSNIITKEELDHVEKIRRSK
jgi:hypothetical protein